MDAAGPQELEAIISGLLIQCLKGTLVVSVISKRTGSPVLLWIIGHVL